MSGTLFEFLRQDVTTSRWWLWWASFSATCLGLKGIYDVVAWLS